MASPSPWKCIAAVWLVLSIATRALHIPSPGSHPSSLRAASPTAPCAVDYSSLAKTAAAMVAPGKGILAADESTQTIGKRFAMIGLENTAENRWKYRSLLLSTSGLEQYISGTILSEETFDQRASNGVRFVDALKEMGILPGIKLDLGLAPLVGAEMQSSGLEGLRERARRFVQKGASFGKWRTVFRIDEDSPSSIAVKENAAALAQYAKIAQEEGLVPIVEPEVLMTGSHSIERAAEVQEHVLKAVFADLQKWNVDLSCLLLKPSMTCPGTESGSASKELVAQYTIRTLEKSVPQSVAGVAFLSGGLCEESASSYLDTINKLPRQGPWKLSFSFGRALQQSCLKVWNGKEEKVADAQRELLSRARANSLATLGQYACSELAATAERVVLVKEEAFVRSGDSSRTVI